MGIRVSDTALPSAPVTKEFLREHGLDFRLRNVLYKAMWRRPRTDTWPKQI